MRGGIVAWSVIIFCHRISSHTHTHTLSPTHRQWKNLHVEVEDKSSQTPLGYGWHNVSFPVGALESRSVGVDITITAAFSNLAPLIKAQCTAQGFVTFASYGK